jgi:hypothetical protein
MKPLLLTLLLVGWLAGQVFAQSDREVAARASALELAGAFANDGFRTRDGHHLGKLETGKDCVVSLNLYAGNDYWFCLASSSDKAKVSVSVFDEEGKPLETEVFEDGARAAAALSATVSGPYFVRLRLVEGDPAAFCFLYTYK